MITLTFSFRSFRHVSITFQDFRFSFDRFSIHILPFYSRISDGKLAEKTNFKIFRGFHQTVFLSFFFNREEKRAKQQNKKFFNKMAILVAILALRVRNQ